MQLLSSREMGHKYMHLELRETQRHRETETQRNRDTERQRHRENLRDYMLGDLMENPPHCTFTGIL